MWCWTRASRRALAPIALSLVAVAVALPARADNAAPPGFAVAVLVVTLNRQPQREPIVALRDARGAVFVAAADFAQWRLRVPDAAALVHAGERYYPLAALPGLVASVNESAQALVIEAPAALFPATPIDVAAAPAPLPRRSASGGFLNYNLLASHESGTTSTAASLELGLFGASGVVTNSGTVGDGDSVPHWTRLESTWTYAMPSRIAALRAGDAISRAGAWGHALRFGGVQLATDFATRPDLVLSPGEAVAGQAIVPSTVDVFVNNALVAQQPVRPGPFSITNIPPVTGAGNVTLVIRDELGREQVITRPFYASQALLRPGLDDFSVEAGWLRRNFGIASDDYGPWFASATFRRGLSSEATGEVRAEAEAGLVNVGASGDVLVGELGIVDASLAAGRNPVGSGARVAVGFERQSPGLSMAVHGAWASPRFRQLGDFESTLTVEREVIATAGYGFGRFGTASIAYVDRHYREQSAAAIASFGYSLGLDRWGYLAASLTRVRGDGGATAINVIWTVPFGTATSTTLGVDRVRGAGASRDEVSLSAQRNLPAGEGVGWRLRASDNGPRQAQIDVQGRYASLSAEVAEVQRRTGERVSLTGGIGAIADSLFVSRTIDDSFGLVRVRGYPDVRVYAQNQEIGRTDASGSLVVPRLLAYQRNALRIEQADLPFDAEFDALVQEAVPYARNGVVVDFAVRPARGALVTFVLENGQPVPSGARASIDGSERSFAVANDGVAYLAGLAAQNRVVLSWRDRTCTVAFDVPATGDPQPRLGPFVCRSQPR